MQNDFGRFILGSGASFRKNNYAREAVDAALQGREYRAYLTPRLIVTSCSFVQAGLDYTRDETASDSYGSDRLRYSLGGYYFFKYGFSLFVEGGLTQARHHAGQWYVTDDYRLDYIRRQDIVKEFTVELGSNIWEGLGMRPTLQYAYIRQNSNIWSHDYDRHRINLLTTFRF